MIKIKQVFQTKVVYSINITFQVGVPLRNTYLKGDINRIEKVLKSYIKRIQAMHDISYHQRLGKIKLPSFCALEISFLKLSKNGTELQCVQKKWCTRFCLSSNNYYLYCENIYVGLGV